MRISDWSSDVCSSDLKVTPEQEITGSLQRCLQGDGRSEDPTLRFCLDCPSPMPKAGRSQRLSTPGPVLYWCQGQFGPTPLASGIVSDTFSHTFFYSVRIGRTILSSEEHTSELQSLMR